MKQPSTQATPRDSLSIDAHLVPVPRLDLVSRGHTPFSCGRGCGHARLTCTMPERTCHGMQMEELDTSAVLGGRAPLLPSTTSQLGDTAVSRSARRAAGNQARYKRESGLRY